MNKSCIYICENSPPQIILAYAQQFKEDFSRFLRLRSQELTEGGSMVLVFLGRETSDHFDRGNSFLWELLARSFSILISKVYKMFIFIRRFLFSQTNISSNHKMRHLYIIFHLSSLKIGGNSIRFSQLDVQFFWIDMIWENISLLILFCKIEGGDVYV